MTNSVPGQSHGKGETRVYATETKLDLLAPVKGTEFIAKLRFPSDRVYRERVRRYSVRISRDN